MLLWRIEPSPTGICIGPTLAEDLALHLRYAPLTTVLAQIGSQQQAYVSTPGCAGCGHRRCTPDCRMNLLRRMLLADHVAADLRPIPLGLSARPYTRLVLAVPGPQARPLDADVLTPWRDARVWAVWRMVLGQQVVGAALAVGAEGPEPLTALRERGWIGIVAPRPLVRHVRQPQPFGLPYGWRWTTPAHMLLPRFVAEAPRESAAFNHEPIITPAPAETLRTITDTPPIPFMVAGQVCGVLTSMLLIQALAAFATIEQHLMAAKATSPETMDPMPASTGMPTTAIPDPVPTSAAPPRRPLRRWAVPVVPAVATPQESAPPTKPDAGTSAAHREALPPPAAGAEVHESVSAVTMAGAPTQKVAETAPSASVEDTSAAQPAEPALPMAQADDAIRLVDTTVITPDQHPPTSPRGEPLTRAHARNAASQHEQRPTPAAAAPIRWVAGPYLTADEVESLMQAIVQTDSLFTGPAGHYGLSPRVMKNLFDLERRDATPLLAWLGAAELLVAPKDVSKPWLRPRPLVTRDLTMIAARLAATPLPAESTIAALFGTK